MVEGFLDANEVAEKLKITINNLRQLQFRKQLQWAERRGRKVFYRIEDIEKFLEAKKKNH